MANSLRVKIKKLCHDGKIDIEECEMLLKKLDGHDKQIKDEVIENFKTDMINKINFEEKWLFDCKSNNSNTNISFSTLRTFCENLAKHLKGEQNE